MKDLCRGKSIKDKSWVIGYYILLHKTTYCFAGEEDESNEMHRIVHERMTDWGLPNVYMMTDVIPETVCRSSGFRDKGNKGVYIFENDIIKHTYRGKTIIKPIIYREGAFWVKLNDEEFKLLVWFIQHGEPEVVGNIFDNPDLLNG